MTPPATAPVFGQSATFTVTVTDSAPGGSGPGGTVTFKDNGTPIGSVAITNGTATFTTAGLGAGSHNITATYYGDANFTGNTSPDTPLTVNKATSTATVTASSSTPDYGQSLDVTAQIAAAPPGGGTATGSVSFYNGATLLGTAPLTNGVPTYSINNLPASSTPYAIMAFYLGDDNFTSITSQSFSVTVDKSETWVDLASSASSIISGTSVTFTATVTNLSAPSVLPTGTVTFKDGTTELCTVPLTNGQATYTTNSLTTGDHSITAIYNGTSNFESSTSMSWMQGVDPDPGPCATVSTSADTNSCDSLRGNIEDALPKLATQDVTITVGVSTLDLDGPLPDLANNDGTHTLYLIGLTSIDNTTGRCTAGTTLQKSLTYTSSAPVLTLGNRINVTGFIIHGFNGDGIDINGSNNVVTCMNIGTTLGNAGDGVKISGSSNALGSSNDASLGNLIGGNAGASIRVVSGSGNQDYNNWVGLNAAGTGSHKNGNQVLVIAAGGRFKLFAGNRFRS